MNGHTINELIKNKNQRIDGDVILIHGVAGTGKSYIAFQSVLMILRTDF